MGVPIGSSRLAVDENDDDSSDKNNTSSNDGKVERIYVGGFHPPHHLTVSEFMQRLQTSLSSTVEILPSTESSSTTTTIYSDEDARYVHLNVRRRTNATNDDHDDESALDKIAKLYHNVTWKGCKLKVQAAKPHFLHRLRQEIQERRQATTVTPVVKTQINEQKDTAITTASASSSTRRRRYLKIRERYGAQAFSVDTKPYAVHSWRDMHALLRKIDKRKRHFQEEHLKHIANHHHHPNNNNLPMDALVAATNKSNQQGMESGSMRSHSKLNRAVHLRFSDETVGEEGTTKDNQKKSSAVSPNEYDNHSDDESSDSSNLVESSSDSSSSSSDSSANNRKEQKSTYIWSSSSEEGDSDDDADDDSDSDQTNDDDNGKTMERTPQDVISISSDSDSDVENGKDTNSAKCTDKISEYTETAGDPVEDLDDFQIPTAKEDDPDESDSSSDGDSDSSPVQMEQEDSDLVQDVEANLGVLASLFPDMKTTKPRKVDSDHKEGSEETEYSPSKRQHKSGWTSSGIMLRYDPTKDVSPRKRTDDTMKTQASHVIDDNKKDEDDDSHGTESSSDAAGKSSHSQPKKSSNTKEGNDSDEIENDSDEDKNATGQSEIVSEREKASGNIYKQEKLEDVFREAREAAISTFDPVVVQAGSNVEDAPTTGTFAFGFNLGTEETVNDSPPPSKSSARFSFSFFNAAKEEKDEELIPAEKDANTDAMQADKTSTTDHDQTDMPTFRRRGMVFPKEVLDKYQEDFYVMNDGLKILQDLKRYRNDDEVKEHWKQERQTLTLDWKRKRKYATQARNKNANQFKRQHRK